jgi:hypothetical protein
VAFGTCGDRGRCHHRRSELVDHHEEFEPDYTLMNWIAIGLCSVLPTLFFNWR